MPMSVLDFPAEPQCGGSQWFVEDFEQLAALTALVLLGRQQHAASILNGAQPIAAVVPAAVKARLQRELILPADADPWHRDGLLFEIICWLVARKTAGMDEVISPPHMKSTQQGTDTLKVAFDPVERRLVSTTVYEYKCTDKARRKFKQEILPAFGQYFKGARDDELTQTMLALLERFELTDEEQKLAYEKLVLDRPLSFRAALTVTPDAFPAPKCVKLFKGYDGLGTPVESRHGDTFPLPNIREWFNDFAAAVWDRI